MITAVPAGYDVHAATPDEIPEIARTLIEYDLEVGGYSDFSEEDLQEITKRRSIFDIEKDAWVVRHEGGIAALALTWGGNSDVLSAVGIVRQSHVGVGLGSFLVDCTEDRARRLASSRPRRTIVLHNSVDMKDTGGIVLLGKRGYESVRRHYTMQMMLDHAIDPVVPPAIEIRTCRPSDAPLLHRLLQETFADHWDHRPVSYEEWSDAFLSRKDTDASLWFLAEADGDPIGFLLGTFDGPRGWVSDLGVVSAWRRRGVGGALLRHALAEFRRRGFTEAGLGVDAGNETGAVRVYERAGLQAVRIYETFEKTIGAGLD
jgi:ribosomal protein S18 acetylase RimI-like enzyme